MVIVFECSDGVGKSSVIEGVKERLSVFGKVLSLRTPDEEFISLRSVIDNKHDVNTSFRFYYMATLYTSIIIDINKLDYDYILIDRYFYSTIASHTFKGLKLNMKLFELFPNPDLLIWITANNKLREERIFNRSQIPEYHDLISLNKKAQKHLEDVYGNFDFKEIDNSGDIKNTVSAIMDLINLNK